MKIIAVVEKGAIEDIETLRSALRDRPAIVETNPRAKKAITVYCQRDDSQLHAVFERGAVDDVSELRLELSRDIAVVVVNPGRSFEMLEWTGAKKIPNA
jgi:hypothetical protein